MRPGVAEDRSLIWRQTSETVWNDLSAEERSRLDRSTFEEHFRSHAKSIIESPETGIFIAEDESGTAIGYVCVGDAYSMLTPIRFGFIYDIWVAPDVRRQGVATRLLAGAEEWCRARELRFLRLEVGARNAGARRLYASTGFGEERIALAKPL